MQFIKFILSMLYFFLSVECFFACLGAAASFVIGIIFTIREAHGFKTVHRPWLLIVLGVAVPVASFLIAETVCPLLLNLAR